MKIIIYMINFNDYFAAPLQFLAKKTCRLFLRITILAVLIVGWILPVKFLTLC